MARVIWNSRWEKAHNRALQRREVQIRMPAHTPITQVIWWGGTGHSPLYRSRDVPQRNRDVRRWFREWPAIRREMSVLMIDVSLEERIQDQRCAL